VCQKVTLAQTERKQNNYLYLEIFLLTLKHLTRQPNYLYLEIFLLTLETFD